MAFMRKIEGPLALCSILIALLLIEYFFQVPQIVTDLSHTLQNYTVIIAAFATFLGTAGLMLTHYERVRIRFGDVWPYSILLMATMTIMILIGLIFTSKGATWEYVFNTAYMPLHISAFCIQGFYYLELSFRAFRARSIESALFAIGVFFVALMNSPVAGVTWSGFDTIGGWIQTVASMGPGRGVHVVAGIGMVLILIRMIFWIDRHHVAGV
jgi:hypothetical protein